MLDADHDNKISFEELIGVILGKMNERRAKYVEQAFENIDKDKDGFIDSEDISRVFEGWKHPEAKSNKRRPEDLLHNVLEILDNCTSLHVITPHQHIAWRQNWWQIHKRRIHTILQIHQCLHRVRCWLRKSLYSRLETRETPSNPDTSSSSTFSKNSSWRAKRTKSQYAKRSGTSGWRRKNA